MDTPTRVTNPRPLLDRWLPARTDVAVPTVGDPTGLEALLFHTTTTPRLTAWAPSTRAIARRALLTFASVCPVDLLDVTPAEIIAYAQHYQTTTLARYGDPSPGRPYLRVALTEHLPFRTQAWRLFVTYAQDFYAWAVRTGLIARSPVEGLTLPPRLPAAKEKVVVVGAWFYRILALPMRPKARAVVHHNNHNDNASDNL